MIWGLEIKPMTNLLAFPVFSSTTIRMDCYLLTAHMLYFSLFFFQKSKKGAWTSPVEGVSCKFCVRNTALRTSPTAVGLAWGCTSQQLHRAHLWKVSSAFSEHLEEINWKRNLLELPRKRTITIWFFTGELRDWNLMKVESDRTGCCKKTQISLQHARIRE